MRKDSTRLAIAIILLWVAGFGFYIAFHPGGVTLADGKKARNPVDVLKWFITTASEGTSKKKKK